MSDSQRAGSAVLHSYGLAVRMSTRPRRVLHIHQDGRSTALCGAKPVEFIGDALTRLGDTCLLWRYCKVCETKGIALDPELMEDWNRGR